MGIKSGLDILDGDGDSPMKQGHANDPEVGRGRGKANTHVGSIGGAESLPNSLGHDASIRVRGDLVSREGQASICRRDRQDDEGGVLPVQSSVDH